MGCKGYGREARESEDGVFCWTRRLDRFAKNVGAKVGPSLTASANRLKLSPSLSVNTKHTLTRELEHQAKAHDHRHDERALLLLVRITWKKI